MSQPKPVKTELRAFRWEGNRAITIDQVVTDGPSALVGKHLTLRLTFEQINDLREHMAEAVKRLGQSDARLAAINARNAE